MKAAIALLAALAMTPSLHAQPATPSAAQASAMSEGVVRKIDAANGKITLKHGPLVTLDMPAMTMVFRVSQARLPEGIKVGDRVRFDAEKLDGAYTVTRIERLP